MSVPPPTLGAVERAFARWRDLREPDALARVFDATASRLLLVAMHLVRDASTAEDLVQATFLDAMRHPERHDGSKALLPWLTGILGKHAAAVRRQARRRLDAARTHRPDEDDPARAVAEREASAEVLRVLDGLPRAYRQVLVLRLVHGLRNVEIARALDCSPQTVRSRLHRGLELVRRALPSSMAVPALAAAAIGTAAGRGIAALRAAVVAEAYALAPATVCTGGAVETAAVGALSLTSTFLMKKVLISFSAVLVLLGVGVLHLFPGAGAPATSEPSRAPGSLAGAARVRAPTAVGGAAASSREPTDAPAIDSANARRLRVVVVEARTNRPVPGAEVISTVGVDVGALADAEFAAYAATAADSEARARRFGRTWRTGSDGRVDVPGSSGWQTVYVARAGALYGEGRAGLDTAELRIELHADRTLRVGVEQADGAPAGGVPLMFGTEWGAGERTYTDIGTSDEAGMLVVRHAQAFLLPLQRMRRHPPRALVVAPRLPGVPAEGVAVDFEHLPVEPLRVRLPPTGRVAVEVAQGEQVVEAGFVPTLTDVTDASERARSPGLRAFFFESLREGTKRVFPYVGLGTRVSLQTVLGSVSLGKQEGAGPTRDGEEVVFRFVVAERAPMVRARLVDAGGQPLVCGNVRVAIDAGGQVLRTNRGTDSDGWFEYFLGAGWAGEPLTMAQFEVLRLGDPTGRMARVELDGAVVDGIVDLGTLVLAEGPFVASGHVVDQVGTAVETESLQVIPAVGAEPPPGSPGLPVSVRTDARGAFTIRGFVAEEELVLVPASLRGDGPFTPLTFRRGATGLRIVWHRRGTIVARVTHDLPFALARVLRLEAIEAASGRPQGSWSAGPDSGTCQRISLSDLPAGRYTVQVRLPDDPVALAVVDGVEVDVGEATDPRLASFDVRGRVRVARVHVVDGNGQPIEGEGRLQLAARAANGISSVDLEAGVFAVPVGSRPVQGTIRVPGFRDHELRDLDGDRTVQLAPALVVRVRLAPDLGLPPGTTLHAFVRPADQKPNPLEWLARAQSGPLAGSGTAGTALPERGAFEFGLAQAGAYEFTFVLADQAWTRGVALPAAPGILTVSSEPTQAFTFTTDGDALRRALLELQGTK